MKTHDSDPAEPAHNWDQSINLRAYSDVEAPSNYSSPELLENYRDLLMQKSQAAARCLANIAPSPNKLKVLELCSGSSRLLYALDRMGRLASGTGVEVSPSRHHFAENWRAALGIAHVHNVHASAHEYGFDQGEIDVAVLIDGALSYLYPVDPELPSRIIGELARALKPAGRIMMEFDVLSERQRAEMRRNGHARTWNKGDEKDAFGYALYQVRPVNWEHTVVENTSLYLPRNQQPEKIKRELYKYYEAGELMRLFDAAGLRTEFYSSFGLEPLTENSVSLVVVARKR